MALIKFKRGPSSNITSQNLEAGEPAFTTDDGKLYIGTEDGKVLINQDVPSVGTAAKADTGTASGNVPVLGTNGKLDSAVLPAIAVTDTFVVESETEMLALSSAEVGDIAVRTDVNKSYILKTAGSSMLANWQVLLTPDCKVSSVNGKTGTVALAASDLGLENVDNTADIVKNVGSAGTLTTPRTVNGVEFNGSAAITNYGTCATAAVTAAKTVALTGFKLVTGAVVTVKFTNTNTAASPTLNVNGTGAKSMDYRGAAITGSTPYLQANGVCTFVYDGTYYRLVSDDSKAPITSPTFSGTPEAPTAAVGTNTNQIATTEFVVAQGYLTSDSELDGGSFYD